MGLPHDSRLLWLERNHTARCRAHTRRLYHGRRAWIAEIKKDAEKEYQLGDVEDSVLQNIVSQLDKEIDFENMTLYN